MEINSEVARSDFKISTGFIEPHFFAGFSGGRKSIVPGVASKSTILSNHSYENISHENASTCILAGNSFTTRQQRLQGWQGWILY